MELQPIYRLAGVYYTYFCKGK